MQEIKRGIGVNVVAFAVVAGIALRRTRLQESGLTRLEVWQPEEGGWQPVRREVVVTRRSAPGGGIEYVETEGYPEPFASALDDPHAWSPNLPADVMVDVLEAQVTSLQDVVASLRRECDELRGKARELDERNAELQTLKRNHERASNEVIELRQAAEKFELDELRQAAEKFELDAQLVNTRESLKDAKALLRRAALTLRRISRSRDIALARRLGAELASDIVAAPVFEFGESKEKGQ